MLRKLVKSIAVLAVVAAFLFAPGGGGPGFARADNVGAVIGAGVGTAVAFPVGTIVGAVVGYVWGSPWWGVPDPAHKCWIDNNFARHCPQMPTGLN